MIKFLPFVLFFLFTQSLGADADLGSVVIVNTGTGITRISSNDLRAIYVGQSATVSGIKLKPVLVAFNTPEVSDDIEKMLGVGPEELQRTWQGLVFQGKIAPPVVVPTESQALVAVFRNTGAITIVSQRKAVLGGKKIQQLTID